MEVKVSHLDGVNCDGKIGRAHDSRFIAWRPISLPQKNEGPKRISLDCASRGETARCSAPDESAFIRNYFFWPPSEAAACAAQMSQARPTCSRFDSSTFAASFAFRKTG